MSERWLYLLPEGLADAGVHWPTWCWQAGQAEVAQANLADAAAQLPGMQVVLILPMELLGWCLAGPMPGRRHPGVQALAYAVEEQLGEALESLHLAFGAVRSDHCYPGLSIDRERLQTVLALLQGLGIEPSAVYADADLLPCMQPCALWFGNRWLLGGGLDGRMALSPADAQTLAPSLPVMPWWAQAGAPDCLGQVSAIASAHGLLVEGRRTAIDLRQGAFRRRRPTLPWPGLLLSLMAIGLLSCAFDHLRGEHLRSRSAQLHEQSVQRFQQLYPDQTRIVDLAAQFQARQRQQRSVQKPHMQQLADISEKVVESGNIRIGRVQMDAGQGWLMEIIAQDFADLERLRQRVPDLNVGSASKTEAGVHASLSWGRS